MTPFQVLLLRLLSIVAGFYIESGTCQATKNKYLARLAGWEAGKNEYTGVE